MTSPYPVRQTVLADGERLPVLIDGETNLPHLTALHYVLFALRPRLRSWRTIDAALRAVGLLLLHLSVVGIDLMERIASGRYLDQIELDRLSATLQAPVRVPTSKSGGRPEPGAVRRARRTAGTLAIILDAMARYVSWLVEFAGRECWSTLAERRDGERLGATFVQRLRGIAPNGGGGGQKRLSLTAEQRSLLLSATAPGKNATFARRRTRHWMDWSLSEGHRCGELLNMRTCDIDLAAGTYRIVRRPDALDDPRRDQPLVKGLGRTLDLSPWLALESQAYLPDRAARPHAAEHDFYFVTDDGRPLSRSSVSKTFRMLREEHESLGGGFVHHVLRHSWVEDFGIEAKAQGFTEVEIARARAYAMGWRDEGSVKSYRNRETQGLARKVSLGLQDRHMARRGGGK